MNFGEKQREYSPKHGKEVDVWQSPKYQESKAKAEEIIASGKYGVQPSDFWILMNAAKTEKMVYSGLIISHNGCLKINDHLDSKFNPSCVSMDKDGYKGSLVYSYCNAEQGIYEVGEVNATNCKNEYPYAMAFKRLFDRVVLKLSKLAYAGIYSDSEADEFAQRLEDAPDQKPEQPKQEQSEQHKPEIGVLPKAKFTPPDIKFRCDDCGAELAPYKTKSGEERGIRHHAELSKKEFGKCLCLSCIKKRQKAAASQ